MVTLALDRVGVTYGRNTVLRDITTPQPLRGGEIVAVIGPNAAGKSSLFRRIAGLASGPGTVTATGSSVAGREGPRICYLPQDTAVNAVLSVYESILLAFKQGGSWAVSDEELTRIDHVLEALDIQHLAFRGLGELSGGQRQLVSIAQTLAREPDIVLLDEPTSALDLHRQFDVLTLMTRLTRERGILTLVSVHDLNQALRFADTVMVLAEATMKAVGPPREVVTARLLADVYRVSARIESGGAAPYVVVEGAL